MTKWEESPKGVNYIAYNKEFSHNIYLQRLMLTTFDFQKIKFFYGLDREKRDLEERLQYSMPEFNTLIAFLRDKGRNKSKYGLQKAKNTNIEATSSYKSDVQRIVNKDY